jgi:hypothetical protein
MPMTTLQVVAEALKEFYLPGLRYQLNDKASPFLAQVEKKTENVVGKEIVMAMRYGRVGGIGNRPDDGTLPTPRSRQTKQAKWETKNLFSRFQITDKTIKASRTSAGAFASLLEQEISDCEADAKLDLSRQALGDGVGTLATVSDVVAGGDANSQTFTVDTTMYLAEGMIVDLIDVSANPDAPLANATGMEVLLVDDATSQVTVKPGGDISNTAGVGDYLVVSGNLGLELTGVGAVMSAGTLYGLSRTTYPWLKAYTKAVNGEISENIIQAGIDRVETKTGSQIDFIQCAYDVRRAYIDLLSANKQTVNSLELKGGWKAISYNGIPLVADKYLPNGTMDLLDLNDWGLYQMSDFEWMDGDGAVLTRVANKAAYEATLYKYCDLGCQRPAGQARLTGITGH